MQRLFSPSTRLHDLLRESEEYDFQGNNGETFKELNLNVSTEELLSVERAFTYADLYAMLESGTAPVWLTPHAAVARNDKSVVHYWLTSWLQVDESCHFCFSADGKDVIAFARSHDHLLEICDVVIRLLAASVVHSVRLYPSDCHRSSLVNDPTFAHLMEQCQSLKALSLHFLEIDEDHCRVLGAYSRPDLDIMLKYCKITSNGANALADILGRNQGPTKLYSCYIDNSVLANGLRGNSSLKCFRPRLSGSTDDGNREVLAIAAALKENKGLVNLELWREFRLSDETWEAVCGSVETHPTLEVLDLGSREAFMAPAKLKSRIQAFVDMLKVNSSIHTVHLNSRYTHHELFRQSVIPYLETNRLRPRLLAIQQTRPIPYRGKVLGRALLAVRTDSNSFWMLLSGNAEVAFPSTTTTTAAAAAVAANTSTADVDAVTASVMATLTTAATASLPIAAADVTAGTSAATPSNASASDDFAPTIAANVATPSNGQKRKARP